MKRRSSLSFALTGGTWFVYLKDYNLSVATAVGFVALAGVAAELGIVVMLLHLKHATAAQIENGPPLTIRLVKPRDNTAAGAWLCPLGHDVRISWACLPPTACAGKAEAADACS
jgi:Cu(I)/Ag(I) efflux system membrane protein CusA/SilA